MRRKPTVALTEFTLSQWNRKRFYPELYLCLDIVDHTVVGETEIPLQRRIYIKGHGNTVFDSPYHIPLRIGKFGNVPVYIRDSENDPASFLKGGVTLTLVFKILPF